MTDQTTADNQAILYNQVEPLTPTLHGSLGLVRVETPLLFARDAHAVPLNTIEFNFALKSYPIVFAGTDTPMPVAVLGMQEKENLFVDADGKWLEAAYVPAYIRRYPFIFGQNQEGSQLTLCIDRSSKLVGENAEFPFFNGQDLTETSQKAMEFCKTFHQQHIATQKFGVIVKEMDLFTSQQVTMKSAEGKTHVVGSYMAVDEKKFNDLKDEAFMILKKAGALPFIYMHLSSLSNWQTLSFRRQQILGAPFPPNAPEVPADQAAKAAPAPGTASVQ
ncbi:MAG: SapC family protein [Alphaproteobacteria bacterium]